MDKKDKILMELKSLSNDDIDYIIRNINYYKYNEFEKNYNYEKALLFKDVCNYCTNIFYQMLDYTLFDTDYLKSKFDFLRIDYK